MKRLIFPFFAGLSLMLLIGTLLLWMRSDTHYDYARWLWATEPDQSPYATFLMNWGGSGSAWKESGVLLVSRKGILFVTFGTSQEDSPSNSPPPTFDWGVDGSGYATLPAKFSAAKLPGLQFIDAEWFGWIGFSHIKALITVPLWVLALLFLLLPLQYLRQTFFHPHRHPPGHCSTCGYDLTHNISGTCPECGTPTTSSAPRSNS